MTVKKLNVITEWKKQKKSLLNEQDYLKRTGGMNFKN